MSPYQSLILMAVVTAGAVHAQTPDHWSVTQSDDKTFIYASTVNDSGAFLGEYCYYATKKCLWILGNTTACEKDHIYPILANSDTGAAQLDINCNGVVNNGIYGYSFTKWSDLEDILQKAERVGFAVPLQKDQFLVYRFKLSGLAAATRQAESAVASAPPTGNVRSTSDTDTSTERL